MARGKDSTRDSSEISFEPDIFLPFNDKPMPIHPPDTAYLTAMPELSPAPKVPTTPDKPTESKWKPLVGTPSKPPVPRNILVPDPSPAQTFSDAESTTTVLTPPSSGSFIHQRRQGEYVARPPIWKIYELDHLSSFSPEIPGVLDDNDYYPESDGFVPLPCHEKSSNENFVLSRKISYSSVHLPGFSFSDQVRKMAEVFNETPLIVNMVNSLEFNGTIDHERTCSASSMYHQSTVDFLCQHQHQHQQPQLPLRMPQQMGQVVSLKMLMVSHR